MSCIPLISHHLFVAALSEKNSLRNVPALFAQPFPSPEIAAREFRVELIHFGRPLPLEAAGPTRAWPRIVPVS
jgi:hypothetical protein